jgi:hypothetical protein
MAGVVQSHRVNRWFYIAMAVCTIIIVGVGFGPSIISTTARNAPLTRLAIAHSALSFVWLVIFLAQTALVATRRVAIHRRLGTAAIFLAPVMIVLGYLVAITMARRGFDLSGDLRIEADPLLALVNPLGDLITFGTLVAADFGTDAEAIFTSALCCSPPSAV